MGTDIGSGSGVGWRRLTGVIASTATLLSMGAIVPSALADDGDAVDGVRASASFVDVNASTPHAENIAWLAQSGVSTGWTRADGKKEFRPALSVTRQDMAAFLYRVAGSPQFDESKVKNPFKDVSKSTPHYREILWLSSSKISTGWSDGTFRGMDTVKRQDMAAFLHRLADLKKASPKLGAAVSFKDVTASTPHQEDIVWLARTGVTTGWKDGTFRGMTAVIRQDMGAFLQRTHDNVLSAKPSTPSKPSQPDKPSEPSKPADKTAPVFSGVKDVTLDYGVKFDAKSGVTAKDAVDGDVTAKISVSGSVDTSKAGTYTLTYTVSDKAGNKATATRKVTVKAQPVDQLKGKVREVVSGGAITQDGSLWTWGSNYSGEVGDGTTNPRLTPYKVPGLTNVKSAGSGWAITGDGSLWTWGSNSYGEVGDGTTNNRLTPYKVPGLTGVKSAAKGWAITGDGSLWTWGSNAPDGTEETRLTPYKVPGLTGVKSAGSGWAVTGDGSLWTWGDNRSGTVGDGTTTDRLTPYKVPGLTDVKSADKGYAITGDGSMWVWGNQSYGVGDGTTNPHLTPYKVPGLSNVAFGMQWGAPTYAVTGDGSLWTWGVNNFGQVGDGTNENRLSPYKVPGLTGVRQVFVTGVVTTVLAGDGSVWTWGGGDNWALLGDGTTNGRTTPYKLPGLTDVKTIGSGYALTGDGSLWMWGRGVPDGTSEQKQLTPYKVRFQ